MAYSVLKRPNGNPEKNMLLHRTNLITFNEVDKEFVYFSVGKSTSGGNPIHEN